MTSSAATAAMLLWVIRKGFLVQVVMAIHKISDVIEGTAKGALDTFSAANSLSELGEELRRLMSQFKFSC
jgi:methyl-accepting chemotaxis protein